MFRARTNKGIRAVALAPDGRLALLHEDRARVCRLGAGGRLVTEYGVAGLPRTICVSGSRVGVAFAPDGALRLLIRGPSQPGSELWGLGRGGAELVARVEEETIDHCFDPAGTALALWAGPSPGEVETPRRARYAVVEVLGGRRLVEWAVPARSAHTLYSDNFRSLHPARGESGIVLLVNITETREAVIEVVYQAGRVVRRVERGGFRYTVGPGRLSPCGRWIQTTAPDQDLALTDTRAPPGQAASVVGARGYAATAAWGPNRLVVPYRDGIQIIDPEQARLIDRLDLGFGEPAGLAGAPDGCRVAAWRGNWLAVVDLAD